MNTKNYLTPTKKYKLIVSAVHMVYRLVNSTYNVPELALRLTRLICQFINANACTIHILDEKKNKVQMIAIFDNKINILLTKNKDLKNISDKEKRVAQGYVVFDDHFIGLPLVADDNIGAVFVKRKSDEPAFDEFDKEILSVVAEQSVTALQNIQLSEKQQKIILESMKFIGSLLERNGHSSSSSHTPAFFKIAKCVAEKLNISEDGINSLYYASVLRDAGAVDVPYHILAKSSNLTAEEFKVIREQPTKNFELIQPVEFLRPVLPILLYHHEKYDGTGYPSGLKQEQIPLGARIMAVVEAFEAMINERPYKKRLTVGEAIEELRKNSGTQFDPLIVNVFVEVSKQKNFRNYLS